MRVHTRSEARRSIITMVYHARMICDKYVRALFVVSLTACGFPACAENTEPQETGQRNTASSDSAGQDVAWSVMINQTQAGPFTSADIRTKLASKEISSASLVWREGMEQWIPAASAIDEIGVARTDAAGTAFLTLCSRAESLPDGDMNTLSQYIRDVRDAPEAKVRSILDRHTTLIKDARNGAVVLGNIWYDYTQGEMLLFEHIAHSRKLARLLAADARIQIKDGNTTQATASCAAVARIARQVTQDKTVTTSLVTMAILRCFADTCTFMDSVADDAVALTDVARWLKSDDPLNFAGTIGVERSFGLTSLHTEVGEGRLAQYAQIATLSRDDFETLHKASDNLDQETANARSACDALIVLIAHGAYPNTLKTADFFDRVDNGEFGGVASVQIGRMELLLIQARRTMTRLEPFLKRFGG